jgi:hypothetical protein
MGNGKANTGYGRLAPERGARRSRLNCTGRKAR